MTVLVDRESVFRRQDLAQAAYVVFARVGADKVRMADIAAQAGCSKPTLYKHFGGKDAALAGAVVWFDIGALACLKRKWAQSQSVDACLEQYMLVMVLARYDALAFAPERSVFDRGIGALSDAAIYHAQVREEALLARLFQQVVPAAQAWTLARSQARSGRQARLVCDTRIDLLAALEDMNAAMLTRLYQPRARAMAGAK